MPCLLPRRSSFHQSVLILYLFARRILPPVMAFTGSLLAAFSPWSAVKAGFLLSEGFYILVLALLFYLMSLLRRAHNEVFYRHPWRLLHRIDD